MEKKFDVLILAAGKETRFKSDKPKALGKFKNTTVLEHNVSVLKSINNIGKIYVAVNSKNHQYFDNIENINLIEIESGKGCGDAVYQALLKLKKEQRENIIICWSDVILEHANIVYVINHYNSNYINVPVVEEVRPYVGFIEEKNIIRKVLFSKKGDDTTQTTWHDMSFFIGKYGLIFEKCAEFEKKYFKDNEFSFLDIFNVYDNIGYIIEIKNGSSKAFNTLEELKELQNEKIKKVG